MSKVTFDMTSNESLIKLYIWSLPHFLLFQFNIWIDGVTDQYFDSWPLLV